MITYDVTLKIITTKLIQFVKKSKNDSKLDDFSYILSISFSTLNLSHQWQRASRAQSLQNMRAREQNREHRARGLALKSGLIIRLFYRARLSSRSSAWRPFLFSASIEIRFCVVLLSNFVFPAFALSSTVKRILRRFRSSLCAKRVFLRKTRFPLGAPFSRLYSVSSLVLIVAVVALFLLKPQMQK